MSVQADPPQTIPVSPRRFLLAIYLFGALGIGTELALMEHVEGVWQQIPLWLIGASVFVLLLHVVSRTRWLVRSFQLLMILFILSGVLGVYLHFDGKAEFKREIDPALQGWELVWECLHGHSLPPVLAPGAMVLLGLIGIAFAISRPASLNKKSQP